jgi:histidine triad (HIT) family protein
VSFNRGRIGLVNRDQSLLCYNEKMENCIFCKIVKGELPCYKVYEDEFFLGFLDINPLGPGHCQLIPKKHYRWVNDVPEYTKYWEVARELSNALIKGLGAIRVNYLVSGVEVPHAHIWLIPRFENDKEMLHVTRMENKPSGEKMLEMAQKISSQLRPK